ncbi:cobalamin B12-binding domain-containing protein [Sphingomicrobium sediminis]|uniref:Cobalamin-dependent protein n=1 Tax=Sphingomicrobium sediminis TaxID=2950949 RepID=A0A9X2EEG1_9SPHN|nr:cobalamin-dependent protein [Sphingomicrobium sediminis]MCM8556513.1 cobalamin-dependent protein [Sphingomicrobium sediminis]
MTDAIRAATHPQRGLLMASVFDAGTAALRKVIDLPLGRAKQDEGEAEADPVQTREQGLGAIIEGDFIPRLFIGHSNSNRRISAAGKSMVTPEETAAFVLLPLELEAAQLVDQVEEYLDRGVSAETIFLDLMAPSARELGRLWEADECDFVDVTMGLWRLQQALRDVAMRAPPITSMYGETPRALFSPRPGDQHHFGAAMIGEVFARGGWQAESLTDPSQGELLQTLGSASYDLVGLTVTCDCNSGALQRLITAIRSVSQNPEICVMVGGRVINDQPEMAALVGADATAVDARAALECADRMLVKTGRHAQLAS